MNAKLTTVEVETRPGHYLTRRVLRELELTNGVVELLIAIPVPGHPEPDLEYFYEERR